MGFRNCHVTMITRRICPVLCLIGLEYHIVQFSIKKHQRHQVALFVRKAESKDENENISTRESLLGVPGVSDNQKLSIKYDFDSFEFSLEVLTE